MKTRALLLTIVLLGIAPMASGVVCPAHAATYTLRRLRVTPPADRDTGKFRFEYGDATTKENKIWRRDLKRLKVLETLTASLNGSISLPADITISFTECGQANASYDPATRHISICYEQLSELRRIFSDGARSQQELSDAVVGATVFIFYHEIGHALIHLLDLPVTGREEDAVDQLSTLILADGTEDGERAALDGARFFYLSSMDDRDRSGSDGFADEHALDRQRYYNIVCLLYGHDGLRYRFLVDDGTLPEDRGTGCAAEFARVKRSWRRLLEPYLKGRDATAAERVK